VSLPTAMLRKAQLLAPVFPWKELRLPSADVPGEGNQGQGRNDELPNGVTHECGWLFNSGIVYSL